LKYQFLIRRITQLQIEQAELMTKAVMNFYIPIWCLTFVSNIKHSQQDSKKQ